MNTGRMPEKMWRVNQTAHTFKDKRKDASKKEARGRTVKGEE